MHFIQLVRDHPKAVKRSIALVSSIFYFISLVVTALIFNKYCGQNPNFGKIVLWPGLDILAWAPIGLMLEFKPAIGWFGNLFGAIALLAYLRSRYKAALIWIFISLSLSLLGIQRLWGEKFFADEGGVCHLVLLNLGIGCWLWLGAQIIIGIGSIVMLSFSKGLTKEGAM